MLRAIGPITGCELLASDGLIGRCRDFLFEDTDWHIRWMVAATGKWLPGRKVLITPVALGQPDWERRRLPVRLARTQIEEAPPLESDAPVSRRWERAWFAHFGFPHYWEGLGAWGLGAQIGPDGDEGLDREGIDEDSGTHLRSCDEVRGYHVEAADGPIGHVDEFIVDDEQWVIRTLVVRTRNLLPGSKVLVPAAVFTDVDWAQRIVTTGLTRADIEESPPYRPDAPVNRERDEHAYDYLGRMVR
jgi:hypothetical protein